jgi:putative glutathione S-transferase
MTQTTVFANAASRRGSTQSSRLDELEERLGKRRILFGGRVTDSDVRFYATLVRFDVACYGAFLANKKRIIDYPNLRAYARDLYQTPGFGSTTGFIGIKKHYYQSTHIDPKDPVVRILTKGPDLFL